MLVTRVKNRRWEKVEKDAIELSSLTRHFELYNRTEGENAKTIRWYIIQELPCQLFRL